MHIGDRLNALPNDEARARSCLEMAERCRDEYFACRDAEIDRIMNPKTRAQKLRWGHYPAAARRRIAMARWRSSAQARELAGDEQMFSRWAGHYSALASFDLAREERPQ